MTAADPAPIPDSATRPSDFEASLSPRFVVYVRDYLLDRGLNPEPVFAKADIESGNCEEWDQPLPAKKVATLLESAAAVSNNPVMGLNMAQSYHYESSSLLILAVLAAPSVAEGIRCLCRYDKYVDTAIDTDFNFDQDQAEFSFELLVPEGVVADQLNEYLLAFLVQALNIATRHRVPVSEVWLKHPDNGNGPVLQEFFGAPVQFGQPRNKMFFDRGYLQERFYSSHSMLYEILVNAMKTYYGSIHSSNGFVDVLCREIIRCGGNAVTTLETIAERLAISPRTLKRRLAEEGYTFQEVKNKAREQRARYYLGSTNMPLAEIAFELGFSEPSAFSRAFRSWVGQAPQSYREQAERLK